ncbi:hypothetical protein [Methylobacterium brachiatum]
MARPLFPIAGLAAILSVGPALAQTPRGEATVPSARIDGSATNPAPKPRRPTPPKRVSAPIPGAAAPAPKAAATSPGRHEGQGSASGLLAALGPDLASSVGIPKTIFVQRFVAESLNRFDRENRQSLTLEQLNQSVSAMEKTVREGALRWWTESDRTRSGRVGLDDAKAAAVDQFRKLTGLRPDQTETRQQSGVREGFERGAAQQFARYDVDGDGFATKAEVERRIGEEIDRIERSARIARVLVEDGTHGRRGFLDKEKATLLLSAAFEALDADRDGILGRDEIPGGRPRPDMGHSEAATKPAGVAPVPKKAEIPHPSAKPMPPAIRAQPKTTTAAPSIVPPKVVVLGPSVGPQSQAPSSEQAAAPTRPVAKAHPPSRPRPAPRTTAAAPAHEAGLFAQPLPTVRDYPVRRAAPQRPAEASAQ